MPKQAGCTHTHTHRYTRRHTHIHAHRRRHCQPAALLSPCPEGERKRESMGRGRGGFSIITCQRSGCAPPLQQFCPSTNLYSIYFSVYHQPSSCSRSLAAFQRLELSPIQFNSFYFVKAQIKHLPRRVFTIFTRTMFSVEKEKLPRKLYFATCSCYIAGIKALY